MLENEVGDAVWGYWFSGPLSNDSLQCKPEPQVAGKALEHVQLRIEKAKAGVSAKKIVIELP